MQRRSFMVATATVLLPAKPPKAKPKRRARRESRGILMRVSTPADFQPTSWRDVPNGAFAVERCYAPRSLGECRAIAKHVNKSCMRKGKGKRLWFVVAATDGRLPENVTPSAPPPPKALKTTAYVVIVEDQNGQRIVDIAPREQMAKLFADSFNDLSAPLGHARYEAVEIAVSGRKGGAV